MFCVLLVLDQANRELRVESTGVVAVVRQVYANLGQSTAQMSQLGSVPDTHGTQIGRNHGLVE